jgi:hypothetical protein
MESLHCKRFNTNKLDEIIVAFLHNYIVVITKLMESFP